MRVKGFLFVGLSYIVAFVAGFFVFDALAGDAGANELIRIALAVLVADVTATVIIWLFGVVFKNSSFYDAYWSLTPFAIVLLLMIKFSHFGVMNIIFMVVFGLWSWRLTLNWAYTFKSLSWQDWRYEKYKSENSFLMWHIINFTGINLMPTIFVYLGLLPGIMVVLQNAAFSFLPLIGAAVIMLGTLCEFFADLQMHSFRSSKEARQKVLDKGLWRYSRHPNYLGEISIWLGVYLFMLPILSHLWFLMVGFLSMILLFMLVSIPLAEKRQLERRPAYADYKKRVSMLLPIPKPQQKIEEQELKTE